MFRAIQRFATVLAFCLLSLFGIAYITDYTGVNGYHEGSKQLLPWSLPAARVGSSGRVFILLIESLRARTALNPELMPHAARLREAGFSCRLATVDPASTYGPVSAAFTGKQVLKGFGIFSAFFMPPEPTHSIFTELKALGLTSCVYADQWSFYPFKEDISERLPRRLVHEPDVESQLRQLRLAKDRFLKGTDHLVVFSLGFLDSIAHRFGITDVEYRDHVRLIDEVLGELDRSFSPQDYFIVMGDHGHTPSGQHAPGLDVPTVFMARGPAFAPGSRSFSIPMKDVYHLLRRVLHLPPLPPWPDGTPSWEWDGPLSDASPISSEQALSQGVGRRVERIWRSWGIHLMAMVLLSLLWTFMWKNYSPLLRLFSHDRKLALFRLFALSLSLGILGFVLGWHSLWFLDQTSSSPDVVANRIWVTIFGIGLWGVWRKAISVNIYGMVIFALPFLLLFPSAESFGAPSVFAPAWIVWTVLLGIEFFIKEREVGSPSSALRQTIQSVILIFFMLQPFFHVDHQDLLRMGFNPLIAEVAPTSLYPRSLLSGFLGWLIIFRPEEGIGNKILAFFLALYIVLLQLRIVPEGGHFCLVLGLILLGMAFIAKEHSRLGFMTDYSRGLSRSLFLCALIVWTFYTLRLGHEIRTDLLLVWGATRLGSLLIVRAARSQRDLRLGLMLLLFLAVVGVGWMTLGWGLIRMEWGFLYEFVAFDRVSRHLGNFLPLILLRYALPVLVIRLLIVDGLPEKIRFPRREIMFGVGIKYITLLGTLLGVGASSGVSVGYTSVLVQIIAFLLLAVGLL